MVTDCFSEDSYKLKVSIQCLLWVRSAPRSCRSAALRRFAGSVTAPCDRRGTCIFSPYLASEKDCLDACSLCASFNVVDSHFGSLRLVHTCPSPYSHVKGLRFNLSLQFLTLLLKFISVDYTAMPQKHGCRMILLRRHV